MPFLFAPPPQAVIPVQDERYEFFPVNRVYGAAKNYAADEKQRAAAAGFVPPLFMKSPDSIHPVADGEVYRMAHAGPHCQDGAGARTGGVPP